MTYSSPLFPDYNQPDNYVDRSSMNYDNGVNSYEGNLAKSPTTAASNTDAGWTSAEQDMAGSIGGGIAQIGGNAIGAGFQNAENSAARAEAKDLAFQIRDDKLNAQKADYKLRVRAQEQEQQQFEIQKRKETWDSRFNIFQQNLQKALDDKQKAVNASNQIFGMAAKDSATRSAIVSMVSTMNKRG